MGWFSRKRELNQEELQLIEKIEKQLGELIREWDESYKKQEFMLEYQYENFAKGLVRSFNHYFSRSLSFFGGVPKPGDLILYGEKKLFKQLWNEMAALYRRIPALIRKGKGEDVAKSLLQDIDMFETKIVRLAEDEAVRWDSRVRALREYIDGKGVEHLSLPVNSYDKKRIVSLYRWDNWDNSRNCGVDEAKDLVEEAVRTKKYRLRFTNRIIAVCKLMRNDLMTLL